MSLMDWVSGRVFKFVHGNNLVYNTCWEDPRLDRVALDLGPTDNVLVITSAGCNALDYALCSPNHVYAVDMNPRQNALLQLKLAGIRELEFEDFFKMFGNGRLEGVRKIYKEKLRPHVNEWSQAYWDKWIKFFDNPKRPFYFRGTSGSFARIIRFYTDRVAKVRTDIDEMLNASSLQEQKQCYEKMHDRFWTRKLKFAMNRDTTLSMLGVPKAQRRQIETQYEGGIVQFIKDCVDTVFGELPLADNYFWRVYMTGSYTKDCCPEYLKPDNFQLLKESHAAKVTTHTDSVQGFLEKHDQPISRFVLLDHMDWLSDRFFPLLESEWQAILARADEKTRIIWRSGGLRTDFIDRIQVTVDGEFRKLADMLTYHPEMSDELHAKDRVHTYGSFYIADLAV
jgi:S-adenosylmethionine-diacylglycerol 3-amino-3-carboxypropyl transferase